MELRDSHRGYRGLRDPIETPIETLETPIEAIGDSETPIEAVGDSETPQGPP